jgi:hypothetical protein
VEIVTDELTLSSTDAYAAAGISARQGDWWITHGAIPLDNPNPGSGRRRRIPAWYVPRLRLLGQISAAFGGDGNGGPKHTVLRMIFDNYENGRFGFDGFALTWEVEES